MSEKIILVTGGYGMVGSAIQKVINEEKTRGEHRNEKWIFVGSKDANLCDKTETDNLFIKYKPTHVVNLAAVVGGMFYNMTHNVECFANNLHINDNVLEVSFRRNVVKVVSCLSSCIFPDVITYPIDETMLHNGLPHPSNYGYSFAKRMIDVINKLTSLECYHRQFGRMFTSVIPCNAFGPNDHFHPTNSHAIPGLIRKMYDAKQRGDTTYTVMGTGKPLRQFIYSMDLARLIVWVLRDYESVEPIMLCVDEKDEVTIAEAARVIKEAVGFEGELVFDVTKADGQMKKTACNKKLRSFLPNYKFTEFKQAIEETVDWYKENKDVARD